MIPIYKPYLSKYKNSARDAIETEWISNYGVYVEKAEKKLNDILNVKYSILMNNGTSATHCLFLALKFKYPNIKKIYVPNNVFIAVWNCALMEYNEDMLEVLKMDPDTLNIDVNKEYIEKLDKDSCVVIVHNLGNIINVPELKKIRPDLIFVEDNCEGLFGKYENIYSGTFSGTLCSSVSFYANKTLTTGEGGAFLTNDLETYDYIKKVYSHGMTNERYIHDSLAYNYRMTNVQAGLLYDQLMDLEHVLEKKNRIFKFYDESFEKNFLNKKIMKLKSNKNTVNSNWIYNIIIPNINFKDFEKYMKENKIEIRPIFFDIRKHKHLDCIKVGFDELDIVKYGVMLPSYPELTENQQTYISKCVNEYIN